jgi:hypothetical protein
VRPVNGEHQDDDDDEIYVILDDNWQPSAILAL